MIARRGTGVMSRMVPVAVLALLLAFVWMAPFREDGLLQSTAKRMEDADAVTTVAQQGVADGDVDEASEAVALEGYDAGQPSSAHDDPEVVADGSALKVQEHDEVTINSSVDGVNTYAGIEDAETADMESAASGKSASGDPVRVQAGGMRPVTGFIFESRGTGIVPRLTVTAPGDKDAFVKLRHEGSNAELLSFYVRSGATVKVCIPSVRCVLSYGLGTEWQGVDAVFGEQGIYAKSDVALDFTHSFNSYAYQIGTEDGNIDPLPITHKDFC